MKLLLTVASWLALPLALLLFAQWPLREWVQAGSRMANDSAQVLFALYAAASIAAASVAGVHLAAHRAAPALHSRKRNLAIAACVLPWCAWTLWAAWPGAWDSVRQLERFSETANPGYFFIKLAVCAMALLVIWQMAKSLRAEGDEP